MSLNLILPRKIYCKHVIKLMLIIVCFERLLESWGMPHAIVFVLDFLNFILLSMMIINRKISIVWKNKMLKYQCIIILLGSCIAIINQVNFQLILWAIRNLFRFIIFCGACCVFLKKEDIPDIMNMFKKIFIINIVIIIFQYINGYRQDMLGGIFGTAKGANSHINVFLIIMSTYYTVNFFLKKESFADFITVIIISIAISIITELKMVLFEIPIIIVCSLMIILMLEKNYKLLFKGFIIMIILIFIIIFGAKMIAFLYPNFSNGNLLSIEGLKYILTRKSGYTGSGDLNRLTAISTLNELPMFESDIFTKIFGLGLGAAEYSSSVRELQSIFYNKYAGLHYYWFSHAWMYIECGYIGLMIYGISFITNISHSFNLIKHYKLKVEENSAIIIGIVCSMLALLLMIYNQCLRIECAFLLYFIFASIYIGGKEKNE